MGDTYKEILVKRKKSIIYVIIKFVLIFIAIALILYPTLLGVLMAAIVLFVAYLVHLNSDIEFEYLYLEKELSIDRIMAKSKRTSVATYQLEKMEIIAVEGSHHLDSYKSKDAQYKTRDFSSKGEGNEYDRYVIYYEGSEKVIIEAPVEFIRVIYNNAPRKVFL